MSLEVKYSPETTCTNHRHLYMSLLLSDWLKDIGSRVLIPMTNSNDHLRNVFV